MNIKRTFIAAVGLLAGTVLQASAQVANGGFSSNASGFNVSPGYANTPASPNANPSGIDGWSGGGLFGINGNDTGTNVKNIFGPANLNLMGGGGQVQDFAFLQNGGGVPAGSLSQGLTLTPGRQYTLSFEAASRKDDLGGMTYPIPTGSATLTSSLGAVQTISISGLSKQYFTLFTGTFTAATTDDTLGFINTNSLGDGSSLDISNISLTIVPVPEPAPWLAGALLLGGAIWTLRRRLHVCLV